MFTGLTVLCRLCRYVYGAATLFHVYMVLSGWVGVWSFFTKCPSLQFYEKLVLIGLRAGVMVIHAIAVSFFLLGVFGGSALPICERLTHLYHQLLLCYRSAVLPFSVLCLLGSLLSLSFEQFGTLLIFTPLEAIALAWHVLVCDAFLKWGNPAADDATRTNDTPARGIKGPPVNVRKVSVATTPKTQAASRQSGRDESRPSVQGPGASSSSTNSGIKSDKTILSKRKDGGRDERASD